MSFIGDQKNRRPSGAINNVFYENSQNVTANYTITTANSAMSTGPVTINSGFVVTIPSGGRWVIL